VQAAIQRKAERTAAAAPPLAIAPALSGQTISVADLSVAASKGDLEARIEMGRRLAQGQGVRKSESSAVSYFKGIISEFEDIGAHDKRGPQVAAAFLEMARFYKNGAPEAKIDANPAQAFSFLHHAASYFGDPAAQFELAKLLMSGEGVTKNTRAAAQWLLSASRKGYAPAQAMLGDLLWHGSDGVKRVAGDGLGLLAIARRNALGADKAWVSKMFETARSEAQPSEILEANAFIVQETGASHFAATSDILIKGGAPGAASEIKVSPSEPNGQQGAAISGASKALSQLGPTPMGLPQSSPNPELAVEKRDARSSAGDIHRYWRRTPEARIRKTAPVRYAGVSD
jgi:TPR repeat protein